MGAVVDRDGDGRCHEKLGDGLLEHLGEEDSPDIIQEKLNVHGVHR